MQRRGARGATGARGERGARGATGARGAKGAQGPVGPTMSRADILAVVDDQFNVMRKQLETQLTRMAQIQQQLDQIHVLVKGLVEQS